MNWLAARIYDRFMLPVEEACLKEWRQGLLAEAKGRVFEIGAGTGANLECYPEDLEEVWLSEPDDFMRGRLEEKLASLGREGFQVSEHRVEDLGEEAGSFDTAVVTLVLCSVPDAADALKAIYRRLKPGGRLLFLEHVGAEESFRYGVQRVLEPVWKRCAGNCHLTRDTARAIEAAGFSIEKIERESMRKALPIVRPSIRGVARR